jgi:hypothetical protein
VENTSDTVVEVAPETPLLNWTHFLVYAAWQPAFGGTYAQTSQVGGKHALKLLLKMWIGLKIMGKCPKSTGSTGSNRSCSL